MKIVTALILTFTLLLPATAIADEKEYVASLAKEIVQNLESKIKQDELLVSLDLIKTKKGKIIPLSRLLREELEYHLNQSSKVTLPSFPAIKTEYLLTGFVRLTKKKPELYVKILNTKTNEKIASYKIKSMETKWKSLYEEHFDDYLQALVEKTNFSAIDQNFYIQKPVFQGKSELKLGKYVRKTLGKMWTDYANVFQEKGASVHWSVKTEISLADNEYNVKMILITDVGNIDYSTVSVSIPARLAPFHLTNVTSKKFIIVPGGVDKGFLDTGKINAHLETLTSAIGEFLSQQQITRVNNAALNKAASKWLNNRSGKKLARKTNYVMEVLYSVEVLKPQGDEVVGGVKGMLELKVYDTATGGLKTTLRLKKMGTYIKESEIDREVERVTRNIEGQLSSAMKDKFRSL